ncbi:MAG TPA: DUF433 domain-containing protein [Thermomicrobiales bacterium]|nr:DUF433 domain-containing protein [Thermomicrobiales bacterium]
MAAVERERDVWQLLEPGRGVYDTARAAALSGVPASTLHYWARTQLYTPSVDPGPRTRLWSWADLLALRAIDWFRRGDDARARAGVPEIRRALAELERAGYSREELTHVMAVSAADGKLYLQLPGKIIRARPGGQGAFPDTLDLVAPYKGAPDLLQPRPLLRIIPGKLHGEPHIAGTRIPTRTIVELDRSGYDLDQIRTMYPDASPEALREAIEFERSLASPRAA